MSDELIAGVTVALAACLGWFWRVGAERGWPVEIFGYLALLMLVAGLTARLRRNRKS